MIRSELIQKIADANPDLSLKHAEKVVQTVFDEIVEALAKGDWAQVTALAAEGRAWRG